jgi:hypothetical protein
MNELSTTVKMDFTNFHLEVVFSDENFFYTFFVSDI